MATERVEFVISADVRDAERGIADVTSSLDNMGDKAVASARKVARADRAVESLGKESGKSADRLEALKFAAQGAGGRVGEMAGRIEALGRAGTLVSAPVAGAAAGIAAVGVGSVAAAAAVVSLTRSSYEALDVLREMHGTALGLDEETVRRIERGEASIQAVGIAAQKVGAEIAAAFGPAIEDAAILAVALAMKVSDGLDGVKDSTIGLSAVMGGFVQGAMKGMIASMTMGLSLIGPFADAVDYLTGKLGDAIATEVGSFLDGLDLDLEGAAVAIDRVMQSLGEDPGDAAEKRAERMIALTRQLRKVTINAQSDTFDREMQLQEAYGDSFEALRDLEAQFEALGLTATEGASVLGMVLDAETALRERAFRDWEKYLEEQEAKRLDLAVGTASKIAGVSNTLTGVLVANAKKQGDADTDAAKRARAAAVIAFRATQAANIAQIALDAQRNAVALAAPPPLGLGPFAGPALAAAQGVAAAASVAAQSPPSFDRGGVVQGSRYPNGTPGQVVVQAEAGEAIFSQQQLDMLGSRMGGGTTVVELRVGNRTTESIMVENRRAGGSFARTRTPRATAQRRYTR